MKRYLSLFLCFLFCALCIGCIPKQQSGNSVQGGTISKEDRQKNVFGADLNGEGGGQIFARTSIALPETGLYTQDAVRLNDNEIVIYCQNSSREASFFSIDTSNLSAKPLDISVHDEIVDMDSMGDDVLTLLTINEEGNYIISKMSPNSTVDSIVLTGLTDSEASSLWYICTCENGYLINAGGIAVAVDKNGALIKTFGPYKGGIQFARTPDGGAIIFSTTVDELGVKVQVLNENFDNVNTYELKHSYSNIYDAGEAGIFALSTGIIYRLDYEKDARSGFCNTQASGGGNNHFIYLSDDRFFAIQSGMPTIWTPSDTDGLVVLRLVTYNMSIPLLEAVKGFNEFSEKYKIDVIDYSVYDEAQNTSLGFTRLSTDIVSGDTPDIYDLEYLPARMLSNRGLFQDFRPYLDSDPTISYSDLLPSAAAAMEDEGKLYYLIPSFYIYTMYGDGEIIGDDTDWNWEDFFALTENHSAQELLGTDMTRNDFLRMVLIFNGEQYFDYGKATCNFLTPEFMRILDFAADMPGEPLPSDSSIWARGYFGNQVLISEYFKTYIDDITIADGVYHGNTSYVGFPTDNKTGVKLAPVIRLAMSSNTMSQEGVWAFFSYLLGDEFQNRVDIINGVPMEGGWKMHGIPSVGLNFEKRLNRWMEVAQRKPLIMAAIANGSPFDIPAKTADESTRETAVSMVDRISGIAELDSNIYTIVIEEAAAFFNGDKTAEAAAKLIQSRVSIYLAEQYG